MSAIASQITGVWIVYSTVCSGADNKQKHQNSASLAFVKGISRWPVNSSHKGLVTRKMSSSRQSWKGRIPVRAVKDIDIKIKTFCFRGWVAMSWNFRWHQNSSLIWNLSCYQSSSLNNVHKFQNTLRFYSGNAFENVLKVSAILCCLRVGYNAKDSERGMGAFKKTSMSS